MTFQTREHVLLLGGRISGILVCDTDIFSWISMMYMSDLYESDLILIGCVILAIEPCHLIVSILGRPSNTLSKF